MKAIALTPGTTNVRLADFPDPKIEKPDEVMLQVIRVGICGTDREETTGGRADAPKGESELVIGHEMLGRVVEVGSNVKSVKKGDLALFTVRRGCGECEPCKNMRSDMCTTGKYTERGIKGRHGYECNFVVDEEKYLVKAPSSIAAIAVLCEPMSVVEKAIDEARIVQSARFSFLKEDNCFKGRTAIVAGLGPVGLLAAVILSLRGAKVIGIDRADETNPKVLILKEIGGTYINDKQLNIEEFQKSYSVDLIVEAAGVAKLDFDLLEILGINGIYVLTGVPGKQSPINVDGATLMRNVVLKNQAIVGSVNASMAHFEMGIKDLEAASKKWPGVIEKMISKKIPYDKFQEAIQGHTSDEIKVVIEWAS